MLSSLSTENKLVLGLTALAFIVFALASSLLVPRYRPDFPGRGGVRLFVIITILLFVAMLAAVQIFGKESEEGEEPAPGETTTVESESAPAPPARVRLQ